MTNNPRCWLPVQRSSEEYCTHCCAGSPLATSAAHAQLAYTITAHSHCPGFGASVTYEYIAGSPARGHRRARYRSDGRCPSSAEPSGWSKRVSLAGSSAGSVGPSQPSEGSADSPSLRPELRNASGAARTFRLEQARAARRGEAQSGAHPSCAKVERVRRNVPLLPPLLSGLAELGSPCHHSWPRMTGAHQQQRRRSGRGAALAP